MALFLEFLQRARRIRIAFSLFLICDFRPDRDDDICRHMRKADGRIGVLTTGRRGQTNRNSRPPVFSIDLHIYLFGLGQNSDGDRRSMVRPEVSLRTSCTRCTPIRKAVSNIPCTLYHRDRFLMRRRGIGSSSTSFPAWRSA